MLWRESLNTKSLAAAAAFAMAAGLLPSIATAQSEADFVAAFAGEWQVYDEAFASGGERCRLTLKQEPQDSTYVLENRSCGSELSGVSTWAIANSQMVLLAGADFVVSLGGNQRRMTGTTAAGMPVILERIGAENEARLLQAARRVTNCFYLGYSSDCASSSDVGKPTAEADQDLQINILVNLNVRAEARNDASVIGVVPADTCIVVELCTTASDGVWCRAGFGDQTGWVRKTVIRQDRWPVVTFVNQCTAPAS